ncbi:MAG: polyprenyl synthetase family protein, partial [Oscillospiraceae bacterium]|nr:polyprenyl synthetase family protein [Oscillospiraceae bacterium]
LLEAACLMGVIAGGGSEERKQAAKAYAAAIGLAFQVRDDMLDATSTSQVMGKTVGKDEVQNKSTFVSLLGLEACEKIVAEQTELAKSALRQTGMETEFFCALADYLAGRSY